MSEKELTPEESDWWWRMGGCKTTEVKGVVYRFIERYEPEVK